MAKLRLTKEQMEGEAPTKPGQYRVRLDGFKPKISKNRDSVNLFPILTIVENPDGLNGKHLRTPLNTKSMRGLEAFCHALGVNLEKYPDGTGGLPGEFDQGDESDPSTWRNYNGPLLGQLADVIATAAGDYNGRPTVNLKFICRLPACSAKHPE